MIEVVAAFAGVAPASIRSSSKSAACSAARLVVCRILREFAGMSNREAGSEVSRSRWAMYREKDRGPRPLEDELYETSVRYLTMGKETGDRLPPGPFAVWEAAQRADSDKRRARQKAIHILLESFPLLSNCEVCAVVGLRPHGELKVRARGASDRLTSDGVAIAELAWIRKNSGLSTSGPVTACSSRSVD